MGPAPSPSSLSRRRRASTQSILPRPPRRLAQHGLAGGDLARSPSHIHAVLTLIGTLRRAAAGCAAMAPARAAPLAPEARSANRRPASCGRDGRDGGDRDQDRARLRLSRRPSKPSVTFRGSPGSARLHGAPSSAISSHAHSSTSDWLGRRRAREDARRLRRPGARPPPPLPRELRRDGRRRRAALRSPIHRALPRARPHPLTGARRARPSCSSPSTGRSSTVEFGCTEIGSIDAGSKCIARAGYTRALRRSAGIGAGGKCQRLQARAKRRDLWKERRGVVAAGATNATPLWNRRWRS